MADKSGNFLGGFLLGTLVGGVLGLVIASKLSESEPEPESILTDTNNLDLQLPNNLTKQELAKRSLEQKIAQLNEAIDAVSQELADAERNGRKQPLVSSSPELNNL
jgi:gas vesicle protein